MVNQGFKPSLSPQQVKDYRRLYEQKPDQFDENTVQALEQHAEYYKLPFAKTSDSFLGEVGNVIGQAAKGFGEGFTTLDMGGDPPKGDAQAIARNLGHLAGFVGYVPAMPFKAIKAYRLAEAAKALRGKSLPMQIANFATAKANKVTNTVLGRALGKRADATKDAVGFLQSNVTRDIASGAFHLGVASAVGSWRGGVDEMLAGFIGGAKTGAVFRGIGNFVRTGSDKGDKGLRALASSLFTGLPSTMRGDTTPMQIYEYVLGAYFGLNEMPVHRRMAGQHLKKMADKKVNDPELVSGWDRIDSPGQKLVLKQLARLNDPATALASDIIKSDPSIKPEQAEILAKEILKAQEKERLSVKFSEEGEPLKEFTAQEIKEINLSREDSDPQTIPTSISVNAKSFVDINMAKYNESLSKGERLESAIDLNNQWAKLIPGGKKTGENPYQKMVNYIQKKHPDFLMEEVDINYWRRIGFTRVREKPVDIITMHNGVARVMASDKNGVTVNDAGNRRQISEEPKSIEKVWVEDAGTKQSPRSILAVLDSVTRNTVTGVREFSLSKYKDYLINRAAAKNDLNESNFPNKSDIKKGEIAYNREIGKTIETMNKDGKYYFGGKGDSERMYFSSYHPSTPGTKTAIKNLYNVIKKELKKAGTSQAEINKIDRDRETFIADYSKGIGSKEKAGKIFDKSYLSNVLYDIRLNGFKSIKDLNRVLKGGFINDAKAFNKRAQIWFTSGYSADTKALNVAVEKSRSKLNKKNDVINDNLNIKIVEDYGSDVAHKVGTPNSKYLEVTDGAILGRSDVIDGLNKGAGLPVEGGANKSFIVSPSPKYGALLGKYMIHSASNKMEAYMQKNNIHFIIPRTAAKQIGTREVGNLGWARNQPVVNAETYKLPAKDIKIVPSEIVDSHSLMPQGLPKQMLTNFTPYGHFDPARSGFKTEAEYHKALDTTFQSMYSALSQKRIEGLPEFNGLVNKLIKNPKVHKKDIPYIVNNLDSIGVRELLSAMKAKGNEEFANAAYAKIQRMNREILEEMRVDGEYSEAQIREMKNEMIDFVTVQERIQKLVPDSLAGFLHKFSRDYRMSVMRNYIVNGITRPQIRNSGSTRMRPYEIGMAREGRTKELEKRDDIFFLDDGYKNLKIDMSGFGKKNTTLGKLWEEYYDPKTNSITDKKIEEVFRAVVTRVPMDSMSGAHVLNFKGFTGVRGFGSLLHGRTMKSLGGADLDGDKAFVFFGGRNAQSGGEGFKKEWKDMYDWSKNEYVDKKGFEEHNKDTINPLTGKTYREELTVQGEIKDDIGRNKALQYSPVIRGKASQAASEGRANLGTAVTQGSYVKSAYSAIRAMDKSTLEKQIKVFGKDFVLQIKATSEDANLRAFRGMTRASIGLSSDPMDEAGLNFGAYGTKLLNKQLDALFDYNIYSMKGNKRVYLSKFQKDKILKRNPTLKRQALVNVMRDINQAIYSKNWSENRRFDMGEIQQKLEILNNPSNMLNESTMNTFLPKIGMDIKGLDWSDGVLKRVNPEKLSEVYGNHKKNVLEGAFDWINKALGRTSSAVPKSAHYKVVDEYKLFTKEGMEAQLDPKSGSYVRDIFNHKGLESYKKFVNPDNMESRARALKKLVKTAEDFVVNDLSDIASYNYINKLSGNIPVKRLAELAKKADDLKKASYIMANRSKKIDTTSKNYSPYTANYLRKVGEYIYGDKTTAALNQSQIDRQIKTFKEGLSLEEAKLFDGLMLSTIWRGKEFDKQAMIKRIGKPREQIAKDEMEAMITDANKTSLSRVGYASEAVSNTSVKGMLKEYSKLFDYSIDKTKPKEIIEKVDKASKKIDEKVTFTDPDGNRIENVELIETAGFDKKTKKYFDELAPFIGLKGGELSKEQKDLSTEIRDHVKHYEIAGKDLNGIMRWLNNKDINEASMADFQTLNRWFKMTRDGTWWQKIMRPVVDKNATISKWHHLMFPKAIGEDLMRRELMLFDKMQPYKSKHGWVRGVVKEPTNMMAKMQGAIHKMQEQSTQMFEEQKEKFDNDLRPYLEGISDGAELFRVAVRQREFKMSYSKEFKERFGDSTSIYNSKSKEYIDKWNQIQKEYNWEVNKNKVYDVTLGGGRVVKMTGEKIVNNINTVLTKWNKIVHGWMNGKRNYDLNRNEFDRKYKALRTAYGFRGDYAIVEQFIKKFDNTIVNGKRVDLTEGIDGLREISKSQMISYFPEARQDVKNNISKGLKIGITGKIDYEAYWPHISGDKKAAAAGLKKQIEEFANDTTLSKERKTKEMTKAIYHYKQITGDFIPNSEINDPYEHASNILRDIATKKAKKSDSISFFTSNPQVGAQHKRDAHIPGWSIEPEVYSQYMRGVIDNMHKHAAQIKVRNDIYKFQRDNIKKTNDAKQTFEWVDFFNLYAQDALGYPQQIPERILNNPNMKIKGTPLSWFNDSRTIKNINNMRSKLGIGKMKDSELPPELQGIDFGRLAAWGNLEAKYQLATLLAHPKSAVANLYGGTVHTLISTGRENFQNARNIRYLQSNVNPEWKNITDVENWVYKLGVVEDFLMYEAGLNPKFKGKKWKDFISEATGKLKKEPELADKELSSIAKKHGISDIVFNKAAWFMRRPERTLRRDAFMAHYLQARNNFQGAITKYDDPMLIEIAKRGVQSTQFLYSAPFRPAFARSTMGKVMTRFQLWAWNSVRFRNQIIKEANLRGFREGTQEYERFKRLAIADMMMMGLSSIFMYSLFENALPAPWNWLQDLSDWAFGNERERSRAFFGTYPEAVAPLQLITPPSLRILPPLFKGMMNGDYERLSGYYAWSMFPFGRIGHDLVGKGGLTTNPTRVIEKLTGLPYQQFGRYVKKDKDKEMIKVG